MASNNKGLKRVIKATGYSMQGLASAFKFESAFRQELLLAIILIPLAFYLGDSSVERVLMIGSVLIVLIVELLNSAIETAVDRIGSEKNVLSGRAKDIGSAAVFVALANVVCTWTLLLV